MQGRIYISGAFTKINPSNGRLNKDPHFWTMPPTWGICRTDYRKVINIGDYAFFVLSKKAKLPQMIYGYFRVSEKITHIEAFDRPEFQEKRMGNKNPNGNIIVNAKGQYNRFDNNVHKDRFEKIKQYYIIGDSNDCEFLSETKICRLAPEFIGVLNEIFDRDEISAYKIIGKKGKVLSKSQISHLLSWLRG